MRRFLIIALFLGFEFAAVYTVTTVNAAELFNTVKKPNAESSERQLFNGGTKKSKKSDPMKSSGLQKSIIHRKSDKAVSSELAALVKQHQADMDWGRTHYPNIAVPARTGILKNNRPYMASFAQINGSQRLKHALEIEHGRRVRAAQYAISDERIEERNRNEAAARDADTTARYNQKMKDWEQFKRERRIEKFGAKVGESLGGHQFEKDLKDEDSEGKEEGADKNAALKAEAEEGDDKKSNVVKRERKTKTLSTPRVFNNIE